MNWIYQIVCIIILSLCDRIIFYLDKYWKLKGSLFDCFFVMSCRVWFLYSAILDVFCYFPFSFSHSILISSLLFSLFCRTYYSYLLHFHSFCSFLFCSLFFFPHYYIISDRGSFCWFQIEKHQFLWTGLYIDNSLKSHSSYFFFYTLFFIFSSSHIWICFVK